MYDYDVVFVGSGHAAWHGATILAEAGKRVAMVEEGPVAGTCVNWGCNAKILIDVPFELLEGLTHYQGHGVGKLPRIDWEALVEHKREMVKTVRSSLEQSFLDAGIRVEHGHGRLLDAHTVGVSCEHGERRVSAAQVVLCCGCRPATCDVPGRELLADSRDFLDLEEFPRRIAFVGSGLIACEFACMAAKMGSRALVIGHGKRFLRGFPQAYVKALIKKMSQEGVSFVLREQLVRVEHTRAGVCLYMQSGDSYEVDYAVNATGRVAQVGGLGLEGLGIEFDERGVVVDDHLRTAVPHIYATGDCVRKDQGRLTPTAEFESSYVARHILGDDRPLTYPVVPEVAFTLPRIAQCGVGVDDALGRPDEYRVERVAFGSQLTFMAKGDLLSDFTFVFGTDGLLVGCAILGTDAEVLINIAAFVINLRLGRAELEKMIFSFPTTAYGFLSALIPLLPSQGDAERSA